MIRRTLLTPSSGQGASQSRRPRAALYIYASNKTIYLDKKHKPNMITLSHSEHIQYRYKPWWQAGLSTDTKQATYFLYCCPITTQHVTSIFFFFNFQIPALQMRVRFQQLHTRRRVTTEITLPFRSKEKVAAYLHPNTTMKFK